MRSLVSGSGNEDKDEEDAVEEAARLDGGDSSPLAAAAVLGTRRPGCGRVNLGVTAVEVEDAL